MLWVGLFVSIAAWIAAFVWNLLGASFIMLSAIAAYLFSIGNSLLMMKDAAPDPRHRESCPACAEAISTKAKICPYCRSDVLMAKASL